jgi:heme/copper-type cytochrome/quinol oxidase subunit 1
LTGVLLAVPPADFVLHNSLFLVAHFHNVIIGGVLFGGMAGYHYWFPKAFGFTLDRRLGVISFWCWLIGFYLAFMPLYVLGLLGMTRRMQQTAPRPNRRSLGWQDLGMVQHVTTPRLQLRCVTRGSVVGCLLGHEATRACGACGSL